MNPRFSLALVALALVAGALALMFGDNGGSLPPAPPVSSALISSEQPNEPLPPDQDYVLAISWHPAFCETKPYLDECRDASGDYTATRFALHGLWPQDDEYCGVGERIIRLDEANRWDDLPAIEVSNTTWRDLVRVMPGTQDGLDRHEWVVHGSCAGVSAERYFRRSIDLTEEINRSAVGALMGSRIGQRVTADQLRAAFDDAFGSGAGRRVRLDCESEDGRRLISELRINLAGPVMGTASLRQLIAAGQTTGPRCDGGIVDRAGQ